MDMIIKLPKSENPVTRLIYDSILVIIEQLTKYAKMISCNEAMSAKRMAAMIEREVFNDHGQPEEIIINRIRIFASYYWQSFIRHLGTKSKMSTAYYIQTDGRTERLNQMIKQYLRCYVNYE
jgi:hypothetical protein